MANLKTQNYNSNLKSENVKLRAYRFSLNIIDFVNSFPNKRAYWSIADQLIRSATSIGANETKYWLVLIRDSLTELKPQAAQMLAEADEICRMIGSSVLMLKGKRKL